MCNAARIGIEQFSVTIHGEAVRLVDLVIIGLSYMCSQLHLYGMMLD